MGKTKTFFWVLLLLLATGVSGYAVHLAFLAETVPEFLAERMARGDPFVYAHFLGGSLALFVGVFQLHPGLRRRAIGLHRWLGRIYLLAVLASGVASIQMALIAIGGPFARSGFFLMGVLWLTTGAMAYLRIRQGNVAAHRRWMVRSYAITCAAITLRIYLPLSLAVFRLDFMLVYPIIAWACWVPNLIFAELLFNRTRTQAARQPMTV
jgi:uncharacterized membrane protein